MYNLEEMSYYIHMQEINQAMEPWFNLAGTLSLLKERIYFCTYIRFEAIVICPYFRAWFPQQQTHLHEIKPAHVTKKRKKKKVSITWMICLDFKWSSWSAFYSYRNPNSECGFELGKRFYFEFVARRGRKKIQKERRFFPIELGEYMVMKLPFALYECGVVKDMWVDTFLPGWISNMPTTYMAMIHDFLFRRWLHNDTWKIIRQTRSIFEANQQNNI